MKTLIFFIGLLTLSFNLSLSTNLIKNRNSLFTLTSKAFENGTFIPSRYTPEQEDYNPHLKWENAPKDTKSFALIVEDPDSPSGNWVHWLVIDIPQEVNKIEENTIPGKQIKNSWGIFNWKGPKPPSGTHRYYFRLYALNIEKLNIVNIKQFKKEIEKYAIDSTVLLGKYSSK